MTESFTLELPGGLRWVIEPPADPDGDGHVRTARVSIQASGLEARTTATFSGGPWNPARFFTELAADWRGWPTGRGFPAFGSERKAALWAGRSLFQGSRGIPGTREFTRAR